MKNNRVSPWQSTPTDTVERGIFITLFGVFAMVGAFAFGAATAVAVMADDIDKGYKARIALIDCRMNQSMLENLLVGNGEN